MIYQITTFICDICGAVEETRTATVLLEDKVTKKSGWDYDELGRLICPNHQK